MNDKIIKGTMENFAKELSTGLVFIDFWASWCGPCKMLSPVLDEIVREIDEPVKIAKVNIDEQEQLTEKFQVSGVPTMVLLRDGVEIDRMVGYKPKAQIIEFLRR